MMSFIDEGDELDEIVNEVKSIFRAEEGDGEGETNTYLYFFPALLVKDAENVALFPSEETWTGHTCEENSFSQT